MKFKEIILIIIVFLTLIEKSDLKKYEKLEIKNVASIKKSDLPSEFSDNAYNVVEEFIRKTKDLNFEILLYFDYITGEILKCKIGTKNNVKLKFDDKEFENHKIASIHNHTKDMYTPPSDKNFGIFLRKFEEYELIAANSCLWILKGKIKDEKLTYELNIISKSLFELAEYYSKSKTENIDEIEKICDEEYGKLLSNYINKKNINEIQLVKKEYHND